MSIKTMSFVWQHATVGGSQLLVLLAMADFADDNGRNIYPSMATLAAKSRLSDSQVRRLVHELIALGLVELIETGGWDGRRNRSNEYRIVLERIVEPMEGGTSNLTPPSADARGGTSSMTPPPLHPREYGTSTGASTVLAPVLEDPLLDPSLQRPLKAENNNNSALAVLTLAEAEKAVVVVGVDALMLSMDDDQRMALLSWLWLYNGWHEVNLSWRDIFRRGYESDPFVGMKQPAAVMVSNARSRAPAPLNADDRAEMVDALRRLQEPSP
jgi:hypothetical protein